MDVVGPIAITSNHGRFQYFQSRIGVTTKRLVVNQFKSKSDALSVPRKSLSMSLNLVVQIRVTEDTVTSDHGKSVCSSMF